MALTPIKKNDTDAEKPTFNFIGLEELEEQKK